MRRIRLLRSTPFRLALAFGALFIGAFLITGLVAYQLMKADLTAQLDRSAEETWTVLAATDDGGDLEDLVGAVETYSRLSRPEDRIFLLLDPQGRRLAGNFSTAPASPGLTTLSARAAGLAGHGEYRVFSGDVGGNRLAVGLSFAETHQLERIAQMSFGWALAIVTLISIAGGALLASRVQRRLDSIADTMVEVSHGRLDARIPLTGNGDDIDAVSGQVNAALERLAALVESVKQVSTDIAHDLKTPLHRLKMTIDAAIESNDDGQSVTDELNEARAESDRINTTFDALLRIAQIESGSRKARFAAVDLRDVLAAIAEIYADVAEDDGRSLAVAVMPAAPQLIAGDRELLIQMFANLVENAIRHCPSGTRIGLSLGAHDGTVTATVSDDGPGIPASERENVFRRLYRLDKSRTTPGSGLGLSLVRAVAELHGATLTLEDNQPGLRVRMAFPKLPQ
jgi:signal transduction histidine kinase